MGIHVQLWRARIVYFLQPDKRRNIIRTLKVFGRMFSLSLRLVLALGVLLIMAGVEQNPGSLKKVPQTAAPQASSSLQDRLGSLVMILGTSVSHSRVCKALAASWRTVKA